MDNATQDNAMQYYSTQENATKDNPIQDNSTRKMPRSGNILSVPGM
jgi:hypothetical protein